MAGKLISEPVAFSVTTVNPGWREWLHLRPRVRTFEIKPMYMGTLLLMAPLLLDMELPDLSSKDVFMQTIKSIKDSVADQAMIIALAINNNELRPAHELADYVRQNFTPKMMQDVSKVIVNSMDLTSFLSSIILMKRGMSLLTEGIIASDQSPSPKLSATS